MITDDHLTIESPWLPTRLPGSEVRSGAVKDRGCLGCGWRAYDGPKLHKLFPAEPA
jgi:hypothetical protein